VNLGHLLYGDDLGLLAAGALDAARAEKVRAHAERCAVCGSDLADIERAQKALLEDAAIERPLPISSEALRTRVLAKVRAEGRATTPVRSWGLRPMAAAAALIGVGVLAGWSLSRVAPHPTVEGPAVAEVADAGDPALNAAFYERLERNQTRATAARYLAEAQDVLVQVAAAADCPDSPKDSVDIQREAETSRALLQRRAALVSTSPESLLAARGVIEEVEGVLQEVADLKQCTRRSDIDAIARRVDRRRLLMKIDLVTQELAAP
jgi:hypothetical protein